MHKEYPILITEARAAGTIPLLRMVREASPLESDKRLAGSLLIKFRGIKKIKQVLVTKKEKELLFSLEDAFPGGAAPESGKQLELFGDTPSGRPLPTAPVSRAPRSRAEKSERAWSSGGKEGQSVMITGTGLPLSVVGRRWDELSPAHQKRIVESFNPER